MPSCASVRRTGNEDCSTNRMISSFSAARYLMNRTRHRRSRFFEQAVLEQHLGQQLLQLLGLRAQSFDLVAGRFPGGVAREPLLVRLQEFLRSAVVQILVDAFPRHSSAMLSSPRSP